MTLWIGHSSGLLTPNGTTTHTIATPSGAETVAGAFLLLTVATTVDLNTPSGWTLVRYPNFTMRLSLLTRVATAGEATVNLVTDNDMPVIYEIFEFLPGSYLVNSWSASNNVNSTAPWAPLSGLDDVQFYYAALGHGGMATTNSPAAGTVWDGTGLSELQWLAVTGKPYLQFSSEYLENTGQTTWTPTTVTTIPAGASNDDEERVYLGLHVQSAADPTGALLQSTAHFTAGAKSNFHGPISWVSTWPGLLSGTGVTLINPWTPPSILAGDLCVMSVVVKPYTTTISSGGNLSTWTKIGEYAAGTTANARADEGSTKVAVFVKESAAASSMVGNITLTGCNTAQVNVVAYRKSSGQTWDYSAWTAGGQGAPAANYDAAGATGLDLREGDWVIAATGIGGDAGTTSSYSQDGVGGSTLGIVNMRNNVGTTTGYDCRLIVSDAPVTSGDSILPPTYHHANASSLCGTTLFLRLRLPYDYGTDTLQVEAGFSADGFLSGDLLQESDSLGVIFVSTAEGFVASPPYVSGALLITKQEVYVTNGVTPMVTEEIPVDEGDVIIVKASTADAGTTLGTPATSGQSYTLWHSETTAGHCGAWLWGSVISGDPGLITVQVDKTGGAGQVYSIIVERWANVALSGSPVVNLITLISSEAGFVDAIASTDAASAVTWMAADKSAHSPAGVAYRAFARQVGLHDASATNDYVAYYALQDAPGIGDQEFGLDQP